jgi:TonB family protein
MTHSAIWFAIAGKSILVLALAHLITLALRRRSAAARHLVWIASSAVLVALPLLSLSLPALHAPTSEAAAAVFRTTLTVPGRATPSVALTAPPARSAHLIPDLGPLKTPLLFFWLLGSLGSLLHSLLSYSAAHRIRRSARVLDTPSPGVPVLEAPSGLMPMTVGILRPAIVLPSGSSQWSEPLRRTVLAHELAHVRRCDTAAQLLARIALALYWWNPLAWTAWRQLLQEAERAADDAVLHSGARPSDYAAHLLDIARSLQPAPWPAVAIARTSNLETRLRAVLNPHLLRTAPSRAAAITSIALALLLAAPLAAIHAQDTHATPASSDSDLTRQGDLAWNRGDRKSAVTYYQQALNLLSGKPASAHLIERLGAAAILDKNYPQARYDFQEMPYADTSSSGRAAMWQAVVAACENNPALASQFFDQALTLEDPKSLDTAVTLDLYSALLHQQHQDAKANELSNRAAAIRKALVQPSAPPEGVYRIEGGVQSPRPISKTEPTYSDDARAAKLAGTSVLRIVIGADGVVRSPQIVRPLGLGLDESAIEAVNKWRFTPGTKDGRPVPVLATVEVNFRLF